MKQTRTKSIIPAIFTSTNLEPTYIYETSYYMSRSILLALLLDVTTTGVCESVTVGINSLLPWGNEI